MKSNRREFLASGVTAGLTLPLAPRWLHAGKSAVPGDKIVVVLQLRGAFDYMAVCGPFGHAIYPAARPQLAVAPGSAHLIDVPTGMYLHPAMTPLRDLYTQNKVAVIHGVGYPNFNQSHFQAEKIYYAADPTVLNVSAGWLGRYLQLFPSGSGMPSIDMEGSLNPVYEPVSVPVLSNLTNFRFITNPNTTLDQQIELRKLREHAALLRPTADPNLQYVADSVVQSVDAVSTLQSTGTAYTPAVTYPAGNPLNTTFQLMARYILYGLPTHIYYTSQGGYDTHANEGAATGTLATLLDRWTGVVKAFIDDLTAQNSAIADKVIVYVWSEFSRRVGQNGSNGTDHGTATCNFVIGNRVNGGQYSPYPDLNSITPPYNQRNLAMTVDFRRVYAEIIDRWLSGVSAQVLPPGAPTQPLGFLP